MIVYFANLIIVVLSAYGARKSRSKLVSTCLLGLAFCSMVLVAGLRDRTVGSDTPTYIALFNTVNSLEDVVALGLQNGEYGFWALNWLLHLMSTEYYVFLLGVALIVVASYQHAIVELSVQMEVSFFVFITYGIYFFFFNGARQGIAGAICAMAVAPMLRGDLIKYLGLVLLAALFHLSALIMIPVYLIFNTANTTKNNLVLVVTGVLTTVFLEEIVGLASRLDMRFARYAHTDVGGGYYMSGIMFAFGVFFLLFKNRVLFHRAAYDRFLNMFLFGVMVSVVSSILSLNPSGFLRLGMYFSFASVFLWPIVFRNLPDRLSRFTVGYLFVVTFVILFALTTARFGDLVPYALNRTILLTK